MKNILLYTAGFFDGEGSINLLTRQRNKDKWNREYMLTVAVGQKDGATLDWIKDNFGGNVYSVKRDGSYMWTCSNTSARDFLRKILPYLQYKKPQAELALQFYDNRPTKRINPVPKEELERRESIRLGLISMKKTIVKSKYAGSTTKRANPKGM